MEALTVTLETAKKLKAAGFPRTMFMWETRTVDGADYKQSVIEWVDQNRYLYERKGDFIPKVIRDAFPAPTAQEIADQLPKTSAVIHASRNAPDIWEGYHVNMSKPAVRVYAPTMAEALALLWLKLQEAK